jgi:hypothetical protein
VGGEPAGEDSENKGNEDSGQPHVERHISKGRG